MPSKDNLTRKLERIIKPIFLVALFILILLFGFYKEAKAEVSVEVGAGFLSGQYSDGQAILLTERFEKYSVGIGYITEQWVEPRTEPRTFLMESVFLQAYRNVSLSKRFSLGLGVAYYNMTGESSRALGSPFEFTLRIQYQIAEHFSVNVQHNSNAGSVRPNMGQDLLLFGYHF